MFSPLQPRVSTHYWALSAASETQNVRTHGVPGGLYTSMLDQDFENKIYVYEIGLEYVGVDYQRGDEVIRGLLRELSDNDREDATSLFPQLVSTVASDHLMYGRCAFELFKDLDSETPGPRLGVLPGWSLRRRLGSTFQAASVAGELAWRKLPSAALIEFRLPGRLGKELYRTRKRLQTLGANRMRSPTILAGAQPTGYDFGTHQASLDKLTARATKSIGWDGRSTFLERATDSYRVYRRLQFLYTWLTIVSATRQTLNFVCEHPEVNVGTPLKVHVNGLPTVEEVERHIAAVMKGTESLDNITNSILHPRRR